MMVCRMMGQTPLLDCGVTRFRQSLPPESENKTMYWTLLVIGGLVILTILARKLEVRVKRWAQRQAVETFRLRREFLEARFLDMARQLGKPRGLRWVDCDWQAPVTFATDRSTGLLTAFVGVNIRFEAVEGGDMEEVAAVATIRDAAALFHFQDGAWGTGGRALFNMNPDDALQRLADQYEPLPVEVAR